MNGTDKRKQKQFDKIERSIDRITYYVNGVLNFVKEQHPEMSKAKLSEIIAESMDLLDIPDNIR